MRADGYYILEALNQHYLPLFFAAADIVALWRAVMVILE